MNCPACGASVAPAQERCAVCAAVVVASVEGNLAPRLEPIRELPALRRRDRDKEREKNWKDEVSERVKRRRKSRTATRGELPLFRDSEEPLPPPDPSPAPLPAPEPARSESVEARAQRPGEPAADLDDLPLRPLEELFEAHEAAAPAPVLARDEVEQASGRVELGNSETAPPPAVTLGDELPRRTPREVPRLSLGEPSEDLEEVPAGPARPEPAQAFERLAAAAVDTLVLSLLGGVVLYFTLRLTRVGLPGLWPAWPWFAGYLALLALSYATYFTGTTGQTPGKMLAGLRVVDLEGRPPSYARAFLRAALGGFGVAALGAGLVPLLLDSRARALHDRLTRTQVVKG